MDTQRRQLLGLAGSLPVLGLAERAAAGLDDRLVLSDFRGNEVRVIDNAGWRGFSDRVMGGVSNSRFERDVVAGMGCAHLTGNVTRDSGGGFVQMALYLGRGRNGFDASDWDGLELLVHGNDEKYNVHIRTADAYWYEQSYRATVNVESRWQTIRLPWSAFEAHRIDEPLDTAAVQRIGLLGWMREFEADIALAEIALYRDQSSTTV